MTIEQIQTMVAKADGYDTREEWMEDVEKYGLGYFNIWSVIGLLGEAFEMGFCRDGVTRWYAFEDFKGRPCIYFKR
jgi:hypothetical protein